MAPSMHTNYPVPHVNQAPVDAQPRKLRAFLHLASAGVMISGFQALQDVAAGKVMAPQVSYPARLTSNAEI